MDSDSSLTDLSSELSSIGSVSPPPWGYPSPESSQDQNNRKFQGPSANKRIHDDSDSSSCAKKIKLEKKPRVTSHLDLNEETDRIQAEQKKELDVLLKLLSTKRKIIVIAGAGISVSAGIPDFRSSTGLFKTLKSEHKLKASGKQLFDASVYQTGSSTSSFHDMVRNLSQLVSDARPTPFHHLLSQLAKEGRLLRLYTQNVDGIDVAMPFLETKVPLNTKGPYPRSIQLHGGLETMVCSKCNTLAPFQPDLFEGPLAPLCDTCVEADRVRTDHAGKRSHGVGRLRPRIVLYNEHNPDQDAIGAVMASDLKTRPDAVIVVGTTLKIPGVRRIVKELCNVVRDRRDGLSVWMNMDPPPVGKDFGDCWDIVVKGPCDEVANQYSRHLREKVAELEANLIACTESEEERAKDKFVGVEIPTGNKKNILPKLLTPLASPKVKTGKVRIKLNVTPPNESSSVQAGKTANFLDTLSGKTKTTIIKKPRVKSDKPKVKKTGKKTNQPSQAAHSITKHYSVTKSTTKAEKIKTLSPLKFVHHPASSLPSIMEPIPRTAIQNNACPLSWQNLTQISSTPTAKKQQANDGRDTSPLSELRYDSNSPRTVSPTGSIPRGFERLLNWDGEGEETA
jgi:NAD-dependent histone deacetylase SIR2